MNRREFMRAGSVAMAALALPKIATASPLKSELRFGRMDSVRFIEADGNLWDEFDPRYAHANALSLAAPLSPEVEFRAVEILYEDMAKRIPPWYRRYVDINGPFEADHGRSMNVGWIYQPPGGAA
jgi:hypothetical protein